MKIEISQLTKTQEKLSWKQTTTDVLYTAPEWEAGVYVMRLPDGGGLLISCKRPLEYWSSTMLERYDGSYFKVADVHSIMIVTP